MWRGNSKTSRNKTIGQRTTDNGQRTNGRRIKFLVHCPLSVVHCLILFTLLSCSPQIPKDPHTLLQNLPTDPDRLNPIISNSAYSNAVTGYIYEQLFELDNETLLPKPKLARRWEISKDHLRYTFFLREDVRWHDGKPLTADDVIFTYEKIKDPKVDAAPLRNYFKDVLKAEKLDRFTIRFTYGQPYVGALTTIGLMTIIPKHYFDDGTDFNAHPNNRRPIGTGPFRFVEWRTGNKITLVRNENYWGEPYQIRKIIFKMIPDELITFRLFKKRELDLIDLTALQWAKQTGSEKFSKQFVKHKLFTRFGSYNYIGWNLKRPFLKDRRVRKALAHLIDRSEVNQKLLFGLYHEITGPYYPLGPNYNRGLKPIGYDLEEAKKLLDEAGLKDTDGDGIRFRFTLLFSSGLTFYEQLTPILRKNFSEAGIDLDLRRLETITLFRMMQEKDFDAYVAGWGRGAGEEDMYQIFHSSQSAGGSNFIGYANPQVDRLLEEGRREFDDKKRAQIYQEVHRLLYEDQPYLFLFARPDLVGRDQRFKNVKEYPIGLDIREWTVVE